MHKNHDAWMEEKKHLEHFGHERLVFHERDIWWCSIGLNLGDEQDGKNEFFERPVLVLKKFNEKIACVIPMTTQKKASRYYYPIKTSGLSRDSFVILSQIRLVSVKRFRRFMCKASPLQFASIQTQVADLLTKNRSPL